MSYFLTINGIFICIQIMKQIPQGWFFGSTKILSSSLLVFSINAYRGSEDYIKSNLCFAISSYSFSLSGLPYGLDSKTLLFHPSCRCIFSSVQIDLGTKICIGFWQWQYPFSVLNSRTEMVRLGSERYSRLRTSRKNDSWCLVYDLITEVIIPNTKK